MTSIQQYDLPSEVCPICSSGEIYQYHHDFRGNDIYKCRQCTVQFMNPVYSDAYLRDFYATYYDETPFDITEGQIRTNRVKFRFIDKLIKTPGKALDFGCGNGNFMVYAKSRGWNVMGYDVDCEVAEEVSRRIDLPIKCGPLESQDWGAEKFDLIQAHHVIEHLKQPVENLQKLAALLRPGGYLYVAVPNIHAFSARIKFYAEKVGIKRRHVGKYYDSDHHIFYYTPSSLRYLLEKCGFDVLFSMNGSKSEISNNRLVQLFSYYLPNYLYSNSAFFVMARKREEPVGKEDGE